MKDVLATPAIVSEIAEVYLRRFPRQTSTSVSWGSTEIKPLGRNDLLDSEQVKNVQVNGQASAKDNDK